MEVTLMSRHVSLSRGIGILVAGFLLTAAALVYLAPKANGAEVFVPQEPACYPVSPADLLAGKVIDTRISMKADVDVGIWWCSTDKGMQENYRAGNFGFPCEECFRIDFGKLTHANILQMDRAAFRRPVNEAEGARVAITEKLYEPRCTVLSTAATTQVLTATPERQIGPARLDDKGTIVRISTALPLSCYDWIKAGTKLYCSAQGLKDTKARVVEPSGYAVCKLTKAPDDGWPDAGVTA
jgi:hypothetical protein